MDRTIELLLKQLEKTNENVRQCQTYLTIALIVCVVAIVIILFIIFKGKGYFSKDKIIIGDVEDKKELHKEVMELKKLVEEMKREKEKINYAKN